MCFRKLCSLCDKRIWSENSLENLCEQCTKRLGPGLGSYKGQKLAWKPKFA